MALPNNLIIEVQPSGSSDNYGGGFNPSNGNMATDGAATSATGTAPVFSSASYNFASRDIGAWLFIKSGTNWTPGWYKITAVNANAATLDAAVGHAVLFSGTTAVSLSPNTTAGCATTASPTSATWTVDYSQNGGIAFTDLVAATTTTFTSTGNPIGKNMVGNIVQIVSGTGWNPALWEVSSVTGTTGTAGNFSTGSTIATASSTGGTGNLGGALASPGGAGLVAATSTGVQIFIKSAGGSPDYTVASASNNVATGCLSLPGRNSSVASLVIGYATYRMDMGTRPKIQAGSSISTFKLITVSAFGQCVNLDVNCNSYTASTGIDISSRAEATNNVVRNWTSAGILGTNSNGSIAIKNFLTGGSAVAIQLCTTYRNVISGCTNTGITMAGGQESCIGNVVVNCSGATSDGIAVGTDSVCVGNTIYNCGRDGIRLTNVHGRVTDNLSYGSVNSFNNLGSVNTISLYNCAAGAGSTANFAGIAAGQKSNCVTLTADPFVNSGATISTYEDAVTAFQLNNTAGGGAACRAEGINSSDIGALQHQAVAGGGGIFRSAVID